MFEIAKMTPDNRLQLPDEIARRFLPSDQFIVWIEDDTLYLKRITPSPLKAVEQADEGEPMSLDEINEIVHEVRSQRHKQEAE